MDHNNLILISIVLVLFSMMSCSKHSNTIPAITFENEISGDYLDLDKKVRGNHQLLYIGMEREDIHFSSDLFSFEGRSLDDYNGHTIQRPYPNHIEIIVDTTTQIVNPYNRAYRSQGNYGGLLNSYSYPVIIRNLESEAVQLGWGTYLDLIVEVSINEGKWLPIEGVYRYNCGFRIGPIKLYKSEMAISTTPIYCGDVEVLMRLKMGIAHSNVFNSYINEELSKEIVNVLDAIY